MEEVRSMSRLSEMLEEAGESIEAKRVFGAPYEKNGVTIIPAARVMGGVGGGEGPTKAGDEAGGDTSGVGAGFGMSARPAGAYVIKGEDVRWLPAVDVNRLMLGFQVVMIVFFLVLRSIVKARSAAEAARADEAAT
jgi:uncharacterized spore protein YtfJ